MDLLLITSSWPHTEVPEFLDDEIRYLAERFGSVVVAPMRPRGLRRAPLPDNVGVNYLLAERLVRGRLLLGRAARAANAAAQVALPNACGLGFSRSDYLMDGMRWSWTRHAVLSRADARSVLQWASSMRQPRLAYTFWLGATTVAIRRAWPSAPLVSRVHGGDLFSEAHGWASIPFQQSALRSADLVASVSDAGRAYLSQKFPACNGRIVWRRLGISDLGRLARPSPSGVLRMVSASSIDANKRVLLISRAAAMLARAGHSVEWTHFGDGPERQLVEHAVADAGLSMRVDLRGRVSNDEVRRDLVTGGYSVFVNLSLSEGSPVSLMEAQCAGLGVVATRVGGSAEVAPGFLNEIIEPTAGLAEICAAIERISQRPKEEAVARRTHWEKRYAARANYSAWAAELSELAQR